MLSQTFSKLSVSVVSYVVKGLTLVRSYGYIVLFANNTDSGESACNELSHLKSALFAF